MSSIEEIVKDILKQKYGVIEQYYNDDEIKTDIYYYQDLDSIFENHHLTLQDSNANFDMDNSKKILKIKSAKDYNKYYYFLTLQMKN